MSIETPDALAFIAIIEQDITILASYQKGISFLMPLNISHFRLLIY